MGKCRILTWPIKTNILSLCYTNEVTSQLGLNESQLFVELWTIRIVSRAYILRVVRASKYTDQGSHVVVISFIYYF